MLDVMCFMKFQGFSTDQFVLYKADNDRLYQLFLGCPNDVVVWS